MVESRGEARVKPVDALWEDAMARFADIVRLMRRARGIRNARSARKGVKR